jgi:uncharacterized protein with PIN domain
MDQASKKPCFAHRHWQSPPSRCWKPVSFCTRALAPKRSDELLEHSGISVIPFDAAMADAAFDAFRRFGKGQGHPAQLNIVDCAAYALAKLRGEALLFKGTDFDKTDIQSAL